MHPGARTDFGPPPHFTALEPRLGFGAWAVGGEGWGAPGGEHDRRAAVERALERGITCFDTAPTYGHGASEVLLGRALGAHRERVAIATKVGPHDDPHTSLEASLRRLHSDYVDLVQLHEARERWEWQLEGLSRLQQEGKALALGLCNATHLQIRRALELVPLVSYQGPYNLFDRDVEQRELPLARERRLAFLAYRPLASGLLSGKYAAAPPQFPASDHRRGLFWFHGPEFARRRRVVERLHPIAARLELPLSALALAWVLAQPGVAVVLAGARTKEQVDENLSGARHLTPETLSAIDALVVEAFRLPRATSELNAQAATWGERERFIVEHLDGRTSAEAIAAEWTDRGEKPMIAAQVKVFGDQLAEQGLVVTDNG